MTTVAERFKAFYWFFIPHQAIASPMLAKLLIICTPGQTVIWYFLYAKLISILLFQACLSKQDSFVSSKYVINQKITNFVNVLPCYGDGNIEQGLLSIIFSTWMAWCRRFGVTGCLSKGNMYTHITYHIYLYIYWNLSRHSSYHNISSVFLWRCIVTGLRSLSMHWKMLSHHYK